MMPINDCGKYGLMLICTITITLTYGEEPELKLVNVIFRHGDRTPDNNGNELYPTDPYLNYNFYPEGLGELTNNGKMREYKLGKMLRKKYDTLLGNVYTPNVLRAHSSDYNRTKMSLQLVLASLFPPRSVQIWNNELNWQPIPTTYVKRLDDNFFLADECPLYLQEYDEVLNSPDVSGQWHEYEPLRTYLTNATRKNMSSPWDVYYLYHTLMAEYSMNLTLPEWTKPVFPHGELINATVFSYEVASYNVQLRRIYGGVIIRQMRENMIAYKNGKNREVKIFLYSGHETNVAGVLFALNAYDSRIPSYSSAVMMELYEANQKYYVKVFHYLGIPPEIEEVSLPGCDSLCPLDTFLRLTDDVTPSNEELICDKTKTSAYADQKLDANDHRSLDDFIDTLRSNKL